MTDHRSFHRAPRRHGMIFVTAMWIVVVVAALLLVFASSMRSEMASVGNRVATVQASTVEMGAEQYVLSAVDACNGDAVSVLATPAEQIALGDLDGKSPPGYFWILQTNPDDYQDYAFGITDECSKINLNACLNPTLNIARNKTAEGQLLSLPGIGMTPAIADSIIKWTGSAAYTQGQGADSSYYSRAPRPSRLKGAAFESVEELYLIKDVDDTLLWGYDLDHNGMLDANELAAGGDAAASNAANGSGRGIFPYITVWGIDPKTDSNKQKRILVNTININTLKMLNTNLPAWGLGGNIRQNLFATNGKTFTSVLAFAAGAKLKAQDFDKMEDHLTTNTADVSGLINVNTASQQVLMSGLGLTQEQATTLVAARGINGATGDVVTAESNPSTATSYGWILGAGLQDEDLRRIGPLITGRSYFYSADIVAVSGDGRAFKRVRIVIDARTSPPAIIYRKDLTSLGWPLSPDILTSLKTQQPMPKLTNLGTGTPNGLTMMGQ